MSDIKGATFDVEVTTASSWLVPNNTDGDMYTECPFYKKRLTFDTIQVARVIVTWCFFILSSCGNCFVLYCLRKTKRKSHVHNITLHLTLADLAVTFFSMPTDATWNVTMTWLGGEALCKIMQMLKQFGMYISCFMVVVIGLDRACSILSPMSTISQQHKRTKIFLSVAWITSFLSSIPSVVLFSMTTKVFCKDKPAFIQCVDFAVIDKEKLKPYHLFTMFMSFVIPFVITVISYSLLLCEIKKMQKRDRAIMGRKVSRNSADMSKACKKTFILTSMVTASFILLWGPYYALGIYHWFEEENAKKFPREISLWLYSLMYLNPAIHPIIYGVFLKDVRKNFLNILRQICWYFPCGRESLHSKTSETQTCIVKQTKKATLSDNFCLCPKREQHSSTEMLDNARLKTGSVPNVLTRTSQTWIGLNS